MSWGVGAGDTDRKDQHRRASGVGGSPPLGPCFAAAVRHLGYKATPPGTSPDQLEGPLGQCECSGGRWGREGWEQEGPRGHKKCTPSLPQQPSFPCNCPRGLSSGRQGSRRRGPHPPSLLFLWHSLQNPCHSAPSQPKKERKQGK